jgi:ribose 1,5-bisphosphokinase
MTGLLVLVVGPSGSGKDTLLGGAAARLAADPRFAFSRRTVTRTAADEDHETIDVPGFLARLRAGKFVLHWEAHGLHYGIPAAALEPLAQGGIVVANVSRSIILEAAQRFPVVVVEITAPESLRALRLANRGRENSGAIAERLSRQVTPAAGAQLHRIMNDGSIEDGIAALATLLDRLAEERLAASLPQD